MENIKQMIESKIAESDFILIGFGDLCAVKTKEMEKIAPYKQLINTLTDEKLDELLPFLELAYIEENKKKYISFYNKIEELVHDKNYFVVTTNSDDLVLQSNFLNEKIVAPCGSISQFICPTCENSEIYELDDTIYQNNKKIILKEERPELLQMMKCDKCSTTLIPNVVGEKKYLEKGYLPQWNIYMNWLQGCMNRKVCILEMGVGMAYPSIIRWPFEKLAFYNQKAYMFRINNKFSQLVEGISERATAVNADPFDIL